jgi:hypothetical protein
VTQGRGLGLGDGSLKPKRLGTLLESVQCPTFSGLMDCGLWFIRTIIDRLMFM